MRARPIAHLPPSPVSRLTPGHSRGRGHSERCSEMGGKAALGVTETWIQILALPLSKPWFSLTCEVGLLDYRSDGRCNKGGTEASLGALLYWALGAHTTPPSLVGACERMHDRDPCNPPLHSRTHQKTLPDVLGTWLGREKVWQEPGEAFAKLLQWFAPLPRPLLPILFQPAWHPGAQMVPGSGLAGFVLPQDFLPQLFPVIKARVRNMRGESAAHLVHAGGRGGPALLAEDPSPSGPQAQDTSEPAHLRSPTIAHVLGQSDRQGGLDPCPDSVTACL